MGMSCGRVGYGYDTGYGMSMCNGRVRLMGGLPYPKS